MSVGFLVLVDKRCRGILLLTRLELLPSICCYCLATLQAIVEHLSYDLQEMVQIHLLLIPVVLF